MGAPAPLPPLEIRNPEAWRERCDARLQTGDSRSEAIAYADGRQSGPEEFLRSLIAPPAADALVRLAKRRDITLRELLKDILYRAAVDEVLTPEVLAALKPK